MKANIVLFRACIFLIASFLTISVQAESHTDSIFGNTKIRNIVSQADTVMIQRLKLDGLPYGFDPAPYQAGEPIVINEKDRKRIQYLLQQRKTYEWQRIVACIPEYGVKLIFVSASSQVDMYLCFKCGQFLFKETNVDFPFHVSAGLFKPVSSGLVSIIKPYFPQDSEIQALSSRR